MKIKVSTYYPTENKKPFSQFNEGDLMATYGIIWKKVGQELREAVDYSGIYRDWKVMNIGKCYETLPEALFYEVKQLNTNKPCKSE